MRSRYAAYALGKVGYIVQTTHPDSSLRPQNEITWRKELQRFCRETQFVGLQIVATDEIDRQTATVTFRAILWQSEQDASFTEQSLFTRVRGRWLYVGPNGP
jgi:SEC-C motif-containing protein